MKRPTASARVARAERACTVATRFPRGVRAYVTVENSSAIRSALAQPTFDLSHLVSSSADRGGGRGFDNETVLRLPGLMDITWKR